MKRKVIMICGGVVWMVFLYFLTLSPWGVADLKDPWQFGWSIFVMLAGLFVYVHGEYRLDIKGLLKREN